MNGAPRDASPLYPAQSANGPLLRIGLLIDAVRVPAWIARVAEQIQGSGFCRIECVIDSNGARDRDIRPRNYLYNPYARLDARLRRGPHSALHERDLASILTDAVWMHVVPARELGDALPAHADVERIRAANLDVLLRFGFTREWARGLASAARYGVWDYAFGSGSEAGGDSSLFREIQRGDPVSTSELWQWTPTSTAPQLLFRSHGSTHPHSLEMARQAACWKASNFTMRRLRELATTGGLARMEPRSLPAESRAPLGTLEMGRFLARNVAHQARAFVRNRTRVEHWSILWRKSRQLDPDKPAFEGARELPCPRGHFYADPFLFRHEDKDWLFFEDYDYTLGKADIAAISFDADGPVDTARTVFKLEEHLSYPYIFEWRGQIYLMPEIGDVGGPVRLFRARRFPDDWELASELLSGHRAVDATLHEHAGRWYLFVNICETAGSSENDELFLFHAETPLGPFLPHPQNPIVSDVRHARPAGRIFSHAGRWIRPSQDCAGGYGRAVVFNEILVLDPERYEERSLGRLAADREHGFTGCHTYAASGNLEVVDVKRPRFRFAVEA